MQKTLHSEKYWLLIGTRFVQVWNEFNRAEIIQTFVPFVQFPNFRNFPNLLEMFTLWGITKKSALLKVLPLKVYYTVWPCGFLCAWQKENWIVWNCSFMIPNKEDILWEDGLERTNAG